MKDKSEKGKAVEGPEEKHESLIKSGREIKNEAVLLAKSVSTKEQRCQQRLKLKVVATDDLVVQSLLDLRKGSKETRDSDATQDSLCSDTNEEKDDETDDSNNSKMDLFDDESKGHNDVARFGVFMYKKSTEPPKSTYLSPIVNCSYLKYIQNLLNLYTN
ncbi:hypothetical protein Tco_0221735 [Tanacetum coccineum]